MVDPLAEKLHLADQSGQRFPFFSAMFNERFTWIQRNGAHIDSYIRPNAVIGQPPVTLNKEKQ